MMTTDLKRCTDTFCERVAVYKMTAYPNRGQITHSLCDTHVAPWKEAYRNYGFTVRTEYMFPYFG